MSNLPFDQDPLANEGEVQPTILTYEVEIQPATLTYEVEIQPISEEELDQILSRIFDIGKIEARRKGEQQQANEGGEV